MFNFGKTNTTQTLGTTQTPSTNQFSFGNTTATPQINTQPSILGSNATQPAANNTGTTNLFGTSNTANLFGTSNTANAANTTNLFGTSNTANAANTTNLFGTSNTANVTNTNTNTQNLFSTTNATSSNPFQISNTNINAQSQNKPAELAGGSVSENKQDLAIKRTTKFSDLPEQTRNMIIEIERFKKKQMDIGMLLQPEEALVQIDVVRKKTFQIEQSLTSIKLVLEKDTKRVEDAKNIINKCLREADRAVSVVSQAIDDTAWELSGLTPLQMAQRQKNLGSGTDWTNPSTGNLAANQIQREGLVLGRPADPLEASKRIQYVLMNSSATTDFFWNWLTETESKFNEIQSSLDSLEKYIKPATNKTGSGQADGHSASRKITEIIRNQSESLISLAQKLSSINESVIKLQGDLSN
ncbi:hypothetical protein BB559_006167 [Furculomyces boomerangus]|uniref:Uncharacterized protein n=1 Tax=Furculomyces boomerangus TaxID=61424 RepID=A0A2T9Y4A0_9FUNG|nr:hypothetical protein BB559_006167 [Furculomyces boomerangus]